ncbi:alpha/beta fold hydrolase [bacterium AH-315-E10]|nr:alpha/beta fold hydrolase [bacterium AH-315-E10]
MEDILNRMQDVMGECPDESQKVPLDMIVVHEEKIENLLYSKVTYAVEQDDRCIAWLIKPDNLHGPAAACLCLHQTTSVAKDEPAGLSGNPHFHYAKELAALGYVTLVPDYPNFGEYKIDVYDRGYVSGTMKAIWNHMRSVDLLAECKDVDPDRIACIGHSLGGHNTLFLAAFEPRIKVAVSSCGFTSWMRNDAEGNGIDGDLRDWTGPVYMPRIAERYHSRAEQMPFRMEELLSLISPRPLFINAPKRDSMRYDGVVECLNYLQSYYESCPDKLVSCHPNCEHDFPDDVREKAYGFIESFI